MDQAISPTRQVTRGNFWRTDDAWAIAAALSLIGAGIVLFLSGSDAPAWIAVVPPKWSTFQAVGAHFEANRLRYAAQLLVWIAIVTPALHRLGYRASRVVPALSLLWLLSVVLISVGQWTEAVRYNLEPPLLALLAGLAIGNAGLLPGALAEGFRVEFYVKLGVVLLGATLPLSLLVWAGPVALTQASIVSVLTFGVIFLTARRLGLEARFAAVLGAGGAICGVSAAIAIAAAVGARRRDAGVVISIVIAWAIVMIFALPFAAQALHLPAGVGGAWIGTSEFADAAGFAAAQAYDGMAPHAAGATEGGQAVAAFTLLKVVGRDIWIGIWAVVLSVAFAWRGDVDGLSDRARLSEVWTRFPKFVLGFLAASVALTLLASSIGHHAFTKLATPGLVTPIKNMRTDAFAFGFLAIGLTTRLSDLANIGRRPLAAFSAGAIVNVAIGLFLSAGVFGAYWTAFGR